MILIHRIKGILHIVQQLDVCGIVRETLRLKVDTVSNLRFNIDRQAITFPLNISLVAVATELIATLILTNRREVVKGRTKDLRSVRMTERKSGQNKRCRGILRGKNDINISETKDTHRKGDLQVCQRKSRREDILSK